jgi:hypothetical protein
LAQKKLPDVRRAGGSHASIANQAWALRKQIKFTRSDAGGERVMIKRIMSAVIALCVASSANAATLRLKNYLAPEDEKQRILNAFVWTA